MPEILRNGRKQLASPVDGASLAVFRICLGLAVAYSMFKWVFPGPGVSNLEHHFGGDGWTFPYPGFEWITPLPIPLLTAWFFATGVAALMFAAGILYRISSVLMFVGYTYFFLLDSALFNNHYYLISLLAFLAIWMPADRRFALRLARQPTGRLIPMWPVFLLRAQMFVVYFFGGIAKINADWITGEPIIGTGIACREMFAGLMPVPDAIGPIHIAQAMAWIGLVFDLAIGFILLVPRTRLLGVALAAIFHGLNWLLLPIGVFPFLGFTASLIFLPPDWPTRFGRWLRSPHIPLPDRAWLVRGAIAVPGMGALMGWPLSAETQTDQAPSGVISKRVTAFVVAWIAVQLIFPLRHFLIAGDPSWTEEGQLFAWRMMLRQKAAGHLTLHLNDSDIYRASADGCQTIDWSKAPAAEAKAVFFPIDGIVFDWSQYPGLNTLYEGLAGYRIIHVTRGSTDEELELEKVTLQDFVHQKIGDGTEVCETRSLTACLDRALHQLNRQFACESSAASDSAELSRAGTAILAARELAGALPDATDTDRKSMILKIHDLIQVALNLPGRELVSAELAWVHPFALLGAEPGQQRFLVIARRETPGEMQALADRLGNGVSFAVWTDFTHLRGYEWGGLPGWFPVVEGRELPVMWNYFRELNPRQCEQMAVRPLLMRQYARRISSVWQNDCGRRPQVNAWGCVMMNYRHPVPLVDPAVDLATVDYSHFNHNNWILPLRSQRIGVVAQTRSMRR